MERYKAYMDQISVSDGLHEKLMQPKPRNSRTIWRSALVSVATCCVCLFLMHTGIETVGEITGIKKEMGEEMMSMAGSEEMVVENVTEISLADRPDLEQFVPRAGSYDYAETPVWQGTGLSGWDISWQSAEASIRLSMRVSQENVPETGEHPTGAWAAEVHEQWTEVERQAREQVNGQSISIELQIDSTQLVYVFEKMETSQVLAWMRAVPYFAELD